MEQEDKESKNFQLTTPYMKVSQSDYQIISIESNGIKKEVQEDDDFAFENPVSQFKSEMRTLAQNIYGMLCRNAYKQLGSILNSALFELKLDGKR